MISQRISPDYSLDGHLCIRTSFPTLLCMSTGNFVYQERSPFLVTSLEKSHSNVIFCNWIHGYAGVFKKKLKKKTRTLWDLMLLGVI